MYLLPVRPGNIGHAWLTLCAEGRNLNLFLLAFNLLVPAYPLDSARLLADVLLYFGCGISRAAKVIAVTATPFAVLLSIFGLLQFTQGPASTTTFVVVFVAVWIAYQVCGLVTLIRAGRESEHPCFKHLPS